MFDRRMRLMAAAISASLSIVTNARAATLTVGNCQNGAFATIQSAVDAASAGDTVAICPGYYSEQVMIAKPITVRGTAAGNQGAAVIVPPPQGITANAADALTGDPEAAQILVQTAPGQSALNKVVLRNLTIDGLNGGIAGCSPSLVGILYQNASGTVAQAMVRNQQLGAALAGCQSGYGLRVETAANGAPSAVTIQNSGVHDYQKNGITALGGQTSVTIIGNSVRGHGPNSGAAENGIEVGAGASGSIRSNSIIDHVSIGTGFAATGILIAGSGNVEVAGNTIGNNDFAVAVETVASGVLAGNADGAAIRNNTIFGTTGFDGIDLCSDGNLVTGNTIADSAEAGVNLDASCGNTGNDNSVTRNAINEGCAGILAGVGTGGNTVSPNTFLNVGNILVNGSQCPDASTGLAARPGPRPRIL